jgi:hypothetical protein
LRILLCRMTDQHLNPFWPAIFSEIVRSCPQIPRFAAFILNSAL